VPPEQCLYIGDDERDIIAAQAASMTTVAAAWGYLGNETPLANWNADLIFSTPQDILRFISPNR
jgi:phosphoglycolate phosphatase